MKHSSIKIWKLYKIEVNKVIRLRQLCPKCGEAFLSKHKNRLYCGKCHYTEFISNKS